MPLGDKFRIYIPVLKPNYYIESMGMHSTYSTIYEYEQTQQLAILEF